MSGYADIAFDREALGEYLLKGAKVYFITRQGAEAVTQDLIGLGLDRAVIEERLVVFCPATVDELRRRMRADAGRNGVYLMTDSLKDFFALSRRGAPCPLDRPDRER